MWKKCGENQLKSDLPILTYYRLTLLPLNKLTLLLYYVKVGYFCYFYAKSCRAGANISLSKAYVPSSPNFVRGVIILFFGFISASEI